MYEPADRLFKLIGGYRAFLQGPNHAVSEFGLVERLPAAIVLDQPWHDQLGGLKGRKALIAVQALPAAADLAAFARQARVNYLGFFGAAKWTVHTSSVPLTAFQAPQYTAYKESRRDAAPTMPLEYP